MFCCEETEAVGVVPLTSHIIVGTIRIRRAAGNNLVLANDTGRGPRITRIITINPNNVISNGRIGVAIGINSGILADGCSNARIGISNRRYAVIHRNSVLTVIRWISPLGLGFRL